MGIHLIRSPLILAAILQAIVAIIHDAVAGQVKVFNARVFFDQNGHTATVVPSVGGEHRVTRFVIFARKSPNATNHSQFSNTNVGDLHLFAPDSDIEGNCQALEFRHICDRNSRLRPVQCGDDRRGRVGSNIVVLDHRTVQRAFRFKTDQETDQFHMQTVSDIIRRGIAVVDGPGDRVVLHIESANRVVDQREIDSGPCVAVKNVPFRLTATHHQRVTNATVVRRIRTDRTDHQTTLAVVGNRVVHNISEQLRPGREVRENPRPPGVSVDHVVRDPTGGITNPPTTTKHTCG